MEPVNDLAAERNDLKKKCQEFYKQLRDAKQARQGAAKAPPRCRQRPANAVATARRFSRLWRPPQLIPTLLAAYS